jgi:SnoaL-like protein
MSAELEDLLAREAIRAQLHNYCRAMDRRDDRLGHAVWHEDGTADYGADVFQGLGRDFVDQVSRSHLRRTAHSHRYLDRWSCRGGRWAIDHRRWVLDFGEVGRHVLNPLSGTGARDRTDPSYAALVP